VQAVAGQAAHLSVLQRAKAALKPLGQAAERIEDAGKAVARRTEAHPYPLRLAFQDACFVAGTPLLTPEGARAIETLREGDRVLSRDEHDSTGPIEPRRVLRNFVRTAMVLTLRVGGQVIRTTAEHPFWVANRSAWIPAGLLEVGDLLEGHDGKRLPVEGIVDEGESATVYNVEVDEFHTYFVGCDQWGFSVWAHNACIVELDTVKDAVEIAANEGKRFKIVDRNKTIGYHADRSIAEKWLDLGTDPDVKKLGRQT
jgi:hypothetical protein